MKSAECVVGGAIQFTTIPTEQTTAITDVLLAVVAVICILQLRRFRAASYWKVDLWSWAFGLLALAALLGAVAHGLDLREATRELLWQPLFLSLGLVVAIFVVAAGYDWWGRATSRRLLPIMLVVAVTFFATTHVFTGTFFVFILYEAAAMAFALVLYVLLAIRGELRGAGIVALAIVLNIVAAGIQASGSVSVTVGVPFDHNGVFHLVQTVALVVLVIGLARGLAHPSKDPNA